MKIQLFNNREEWIEARKGKITGTRLADIVDKRGGGRRIGFYEILAERVAIPAADENPMDRGNRLEEEACNRFAKETRKKVKNDLVIWMRSDNENIAISPDGTIEGTVKGKKKITEAVECKCLNSARHIEAYLTKRIPSEYELQVMQYFIVNPDLKVVHFAFYDPRMPIDFFFIDVTRKEVQEQVDEYLQLEKDVLKELDRLEQVLTF